MVKVKASGAMIKSTIKERAIEALIGRQQEVRALIAEIEDAGLRKSQNWKDAVARANDLQKSIDKLTMEDLSDRREMLKGLLMVLTAVQVLSTAAYKWHDCVKYAFGEVDQASLALLKEISTICVRLDELVGIIDHAEDMRLSYNFADMSDTIEDEEMDAIIHAVYPILERGVQKYMDAGNGHNLQFSKTKRHGT